MTSLRRTLCVTALGLACGLACAQDSFRIGEKPITLPVRLVDGHLIVGAMLYDQAGSSDSVSFEISLDTPGTLTLDGDQFGWLKLDGSAIRAGKDIQVRIDLVGGGTLNFPAKDITPERSSERGEIHNRLTKFFSSQIDDRKVKGMLGLGFLQNYNVALDLKTLQLILTPLDAPPASAEASAADFTARFELRDGRITLPLAAPSIGASRVVLGSSNFDTRIDPAVAKRVDKPAGDVQPVMLVGSGGTFDLCDYVAFRPVALGLAGPPPAPRPPAAQKTAEKKIAETPSTEAASRTATGATTPIVLLSGVDLLQSFRLEIDWAQSRLRLIQQQLPRQLGPDRAFFQAEIVNTADAFQDFLTANATHRLAADAARRLLALRFEEWGVSDEDLMKALQWVVDTAPADRRMETGLVTVNRLAAIPGKTDLTIQAALLALKHSRQAVTVQDTYRLHRILGEQYLIQNNLDAAWKHLMSGAFITISRDPQHTFVVTLNLARVYDRQGRDIRAYSRYKAAMAVQGASISADIRKEITAALERLKAKIPAEQLQMLDS